MKQGFALKGTSNRVIFIVIIMLYITVLALNWNRLHYGIEMSDEAFYVADGFIVANGATPFTENFSAASGSALLYSWIIKIYVAICGGTEGLFLFMRQAFFVYKAIVAGALILLLRRRFAFLPSFLFPLLYLARSSVENFSYNTLLVSFLLLSCVLLFSALREEEKYGKQFSFLGGLLMALAVLAHPMALITAAYLFILLLFFEWRNYKTFSRSVLYVAGGISAGFAVTGYLIIASGGVRPLINGFSRIIAAMGNVPVKGLGLAYAYSVLINALKIFIRNMIIPGAICFLGLLFLPYLLRNKKAFKVDVKAICVFTLVLMQIGNVLLCVYIYARKEPVNYTGMLADIIYCQTYMLLLLLLADKQKDSVILSCFLFSPFFVIYLSFILTASSLSNRVGALFPAVMLCTVLTYRALKGISLPPILASHKSAVINSCTVILTVAFLMACMANYYGYVYREAPISQLTYRMEKGVYKGLHTTLERGEAQLFLEDEIKKVTDGNDTVLFMDQAPQAYFMTEALHCTPSTWDLLYYARSYPANQSLEAIDDSLLHAYFEAAGREPDKIVYIDNKVEPLSLHDEKFLFNQYVSRYYREVYTNGTEQYEITVFRREPV